MNARAWMLALAAIIALVAGCSKPREMREVLTSEGVIRHKIIAHPSLPSFDPDALKGRSCGLTVLEVALRNDAQLVESKVLEAPSAQVGESIRKSVGMWTFKPVPDPEGFVLKGKLSFYSIKEGKAVKTYDPMQVGFVGTCSSQSTIKGVRT